MKKTIGIASLWLYGLVVGVPLASAQTVGLGYAFGAPALVTCGCGESTALLHAGGGGEALIGDTLGVGAELGYMAPFQYFSEGVGIFSVNGSYHFPRTGRDHRTQPFVTAGYSLGFRGGHENLWNVGAGADYWVTPRLGVRAEIRDHIYSEDRTSHIWGPRIGVVIRGAR